MEKVLGIDVGATGIKGNLVDVENGVILESRLKIKTPAKSTPANVLGVMNEIIKHFDWKGKPLGIGFPAIIQNGKTQSASNIDNSWLGFSAKKFLEKGTACPLNIVNDADAAGIAEVAFGQGKEVKGTVILITLGTGLGSAVFHDGKLIPNTELGHLKWKDKVLEKYMSNKVREINNMPWKVWAKELNKGLTHVDFLFSPELIVLGGGISKKFHIFSAYLNGPKSKIVAADMKNDAGIIGAAMSYKLL